jgi:hypothetical protein
MQLSSIAEYIFNTEFGWSEEYTDSQYGSLAEERQKEVILITDWLDAHVGELNILINTDFQVEYKLEYQSKNDPLVVISPTAWNELIHDTDQSPQSDYTLLYRSIEGDLELISETEWNQLLDTTPDHQELYAKAYRGKADQVIIAESEYIAIVNADASKSNDYDEVFQKIEEESVVIELPEYNELPGSQAEADLVDVKDKYEAVYQNNNSSELITEAEWVNLPITQEDSDAQDSRDEYEPIYQPFVEGLKKEESSILIEMYMANYYRKMVRNAMRALDGSSLLSGGSFSFKTIREGDSVIEGHPIKEKQNVASEYRFLENEARGKIKSLVHSYNMFQAKPGQVFGDDAS